MAMDFEIKRDSPELTATVSNKANKTAEAIEINKARVLMFSVDFEQKLLNIRVAMGGFDSRGNWVQDARIVHVMIDGNVSPDFDSIVYNNGGNLRDIDAIVTQAIATRGHALTNHALWGGEPQVTIIKKGNVELFRSTVPPKGPPQIPPGQI